MENFDSRNQYNILIAEIGTHKYIVKLYFLLYIDYSMSNKYTFEVIPMHTRLFDNIEMFLYESDGKFEK